MLVDKCQLINISIQESPIFANITSLLVKFKRRSILFMVFMTNTVPRSLLIQAQLSSLLMLMGGITMMVVFSIKNVEAQLITLSQLLVGESLMMEPSTGLLETHGALQIGVWGATSIL